MDGLRQASRSAVDGPTPDAFARSQASDPQARPAVLHLLAHEYPPLRPAVAANPAADDALLEWLAELHEPTIDAVLALRPAMPAHADENALEDQQHAEPAATHPEAALEPDLPTPVSSAWVGRVESREQNDPQREVRPPLDTAIVVEPDLGGADAGRSANAVGLADGARTGAFASPLPTAAASASQPRASEAGEPLSPADSLLRLPSPALGGAHAASPGSAGGAEDPVRDELSPGRAPEPVEITGSEPDPPPVVERVAEPANHGHASPEIGSKVSGGDAAGVEAPPTPREDEPTASDDGRLPGGEHPRLQEATPRPEDLQPDPSGSAPVAAREPSDAERAAEQASGPLGTPGGGSPASREPASTGIGAVDGSDRRTRGRSRRSSRRVVVVAVATGALAVVVLAAFVLSRAIVGANGGVWVSDLKLAQAALVDVETGRYVDTLPVGSEQFELIQEGDTTVLYDTANSRASLVAPGALFTDDAVSVPVGARLLLGGGALTVLDGRGGLLWVMPPERLRDFRAGETPPALEGLSSGATAAVGTDGAVLVVDPTHATLQRITTTAGTPTNTLVTNLPGVGPEDVLAVSAVGADPVVLNSTSGELLLPGHVVPVPDSPHVRLQRPGPPNESVYLGTPSALITQSLDGSPGTSRPVDGEGSSVPVVVGDCAYAAWSGTGTVLRDCPGEMDDRQSVIADHPNGPFRFRVNGTGVVLNETSTGRVWLLEPELQPIESWPSSS